MFKISDFLIEDQNRGNNKYKYDNKTNKRLLKIIQNNCQV